MSVASRIILKWQKLSQIRRLYMRNYVTILYLIFLWQTCIYELFYPCYGIAVARSERLIDRINSSEIQRNGKEKNLTNHDRRSIINRLQANNQTLMEMKYVISRNGTPIEICSLVRNKNSLIVPEEPKKQNCYIVKRKSCAREFVLTNKVRTVKDCEAEGLSETCITKSRNQLVRSETVLCQMSSTNIQCNDESFIKNVSFAVDPQTAKICQPNRLAICQKRPKIVTVTETQQLCGKEFQETKYRTTKMCITYEHDTDQNNLVGEWKCLNFEHLYQRCLSINEKKQIRSEVARGDQQMKLECTHKGELTFKIMTA